MPFEGFKVVDRGWAEMLSRVSRAGSTRVRAGVIGAKAAELHGDSGITTGEVALINEYGSEAADVPERSFIRSTFKTESKVAAIKRMFVRMVRGVVLSGQSADVALDQIGELAANAIKGTILESPGVPPPNAPDTIRKKGTEHTLVATHAMADAVTHQVVREGEETLDAGSAIGEYESFEVR